MEHPTSHRRTGDACTYTPVLALHAPTPPDKMPASRFRYSPNASPRPCRDACLAHATPTAHRRTGDACTYRPVLALHPRPPIKCPHYKSDTARMLDRGRSRREWSTPQRTAAQETFARTRRYWPCTHAPHKLPASRFRYSPNARPRPSMLRCVLSTCTPHRTAAQETPARTGRYWPCTHARR